VKTAPIWSNQNQRVMQFCLVQDVASLAWATNLADLEMHVPLHRARSIDRPDSVVFDLDPGAPADLVQCCEVGLMRTPPCVGWNASATSLPRCSP